jgi:hypothetical protein
MKPLSLIAVITGLFLLSCSRGLAAVKTYTEEPLARAAKQDATREAATQLISDEPVIVSLNAVSSPTLFRGDNSYVINVPAGATRMEVRLTSINADVDLFVRRGQDVEIVGGQALADYTSDSGGGIESVVITGPSLQPGPYYIAIGLYTTGVSATCMLSATYTGILPTNALNGAQFVAGGGWFTSLFLTNTSSNTENFTVRIFGDNGAALRVPFQQGTTDTLTGSLAPGASQMIETLDGASLQQGWAALIPGTVNTNRLSGFAVFRNRQAGRSDFEAVVPLTRSLGRRFVMLFDNMNGFETGLAVMNPCEFTAITVQVNVREQNGMPGTTYTLNLAPLAHTAVVVSQSFSAAAGKRGSLLLTSTQGKFVVLGLRFNPAGPFTSFPPLSVD